MSSVIVSLEKGYRIIRLNRPEKLNVFDNAMHDALSSAIDDADADEGCRAILLTGMGRGFSAGADLVAIVHNGGDADFGDVLELTFNPLVRRIRTLRMPVVCAVNGVAAGAGANLAFACDVVLASHSARFIQAFVNVGLVPDAGGSWLLPRLVGDARARGLAMLGEPITSGQAEAWGLIWRVVHDEALLEQAQSLTSRLAMQPTATLALMKRLFAASATNTLDQQLDAERDAQRTAGNSDDSKEGVRAFVEKRTPTFHGH